MRVKEALCVVLSWALFCLPALAADAWSVDKLRGSVQHYVDGSWVALTRGDQVPDDRIVRTLADGHVDLLRDSTVISLGPGTQIVIRDEEGRTFTTVQQDSGRIEVEAKVEKVQHFSVETKYLAAVVKGTHFSVDTNAGTSTVSVTRGAVAVLSVLSRRSTTLGIGQTAVVGQTVDLALRGDGELPAIIGADGQPEQVAAVTPDATETPKVDVSSLRLPGNTDAPPAMVSATGAADISADQSSTTPNRGSGSGQTQVASLSGLAGVTALAPNNSPSAGESPEEGFGLLSGGIGLLIGTAIGALLLLFRRFLM